MQRGTEEGTKPILPCEFQMKGKENIEKNHVVVLEPYKPGAHNVTL